jgi:hypothetical protein
LLWKSLRIFKSNFAGTATLPLLVESIARVADIVVSKSDAETVNSFDLIQIGSYLKLVGITIDNTT